MTKHNQHTIALILVFLLHFTTTSALAASPSMNASEAQQSHSPTTTTDVLEAKTVMKSNPFSLDRQQAATQLAQRLIQIPSVTPKDLGCQDLIRQRLKPLGFDCETMQFEDVSNLWCVLESKIKDAPVIAFLGHTDVVPTGPHELWAHPPFEGVIKDDVLYGRGAVDMKGAIASFIVALEEFLRTQSQKHVFNEGADNSNILPSPLPFSIGILLTSDEEGIAQWGTRAVLEELQRRGTTIDMAIIGEPSSLNQVGDVVKVGRRGSLSGDLSIIGIQGHVAYSHLARNPIHESLGALKDLVDEVWDHGTADFPPTSFQISNIQSGTGALNVIPGFKKVHFNFRYSPAVTDNELKERFNAILEKHELEYTLEWSETCLPFESGGGALEPGTSGELVEEAMSAVQDVTGYQSRPCTSGGTSDGRFVAQYYPKAQIVELGHINETIHKVNECVALQDLETLSRIYLRLLQRLRVAEETTRENNESYDQHVFAVQVLE